MSQNSGDLRARRTRKLLRDALMALIEERGFDALTVGEIAARAMVSRAAFYRYYQDKYDLIEQIFEEEMQTLTRNLGSPPHDLITRYDPQHSPTPLRWVRFFEHIEENERFYCMLLGKKGSSWFVAKMRTSIAEKLSERALVAYADKNFSNMQRSFLSDLIAGLVVDAIRWWLEQGRPYTPEQIATRAYHMIFAILKDANTWH